MCAALARRLPVVLATVVFAAVHVQIGVLLPPSGNELQSQHHKVCFVLNLVGGFFLFCFLSLFTFARHGSSMKRNHQGSG